MISMRREQYWCPLVFSQPKRRSEYALPTHVLWADLDEADPMKCRLRPSAAWQTTQGGSATPYDPDPDVRQYMEQAAVIGSMMGVTKKPHWQALWFLGEEFHHRPDLNDNRPYWNRTEIPAQEAAQLSRRIAYHEPGADKGGWDVTQVLRLPGTRNHKHSPPHPIELLWAERRYYTVSQIEQAYPPVPPANGHGDWNDVSTEEVAAALASLPVGVQMALERGGGDRSLELVRMARTLMGLKVPPEIIPHILRNSANNKFKGRSDEKQRLLTAVADAMLG